MAAMVCRAGSQPYLESQLVEPRTPLWFKYSSPIPNFSQLPIEFAFKSCFRDLTSKELSDFPHENEESKVSVPSSISEPPKEPTIMEEKAGENSYVHPLVKRSLSSLSERSLEICTENLGNETGSDFIGSSIFSPAESRGGWSSQSRKKVNSSSSRQILRAGKLNHQHKFPPPLTTMSGSKSLLVRPHRKDGRLIIEAVETTARNNPRFLAERSNGRLRLCLLRSSTTIRTNPETPEDEDSSGEEGRVEMERFERECNCRCKEGEKESSGFLISSWEPLWISSS